MIALASTMLTLFAELAQQVATASRGGTIYTRERDGIAYYYAKIPVGVDRIDTFVGKVGDAAAKQQVENLRREMGLAKGRRKLVSLLRGAGLAAPHRTIGATLDAVAYAGLFDAGTVLVGTAAYMMSGPLVGHFLPEPTLMTGDLDLATADLALTAEPPEAFETILKRGDPTFQSVMQLDPRKPPSRFSTADGFLVDLITPMRSKADINPVPMNGLGAGAAPLQHIDWLISEPVRTVALWGAGVPINVPQPARFAVHKLILAQKRHAGMRVKRQKDLAQADALIEALLVNDPYALEDAMDEARAKGRKGWAVPIERSLIEIDRHMDDYSKLPR
jgi:hypothetical protein